MPSQGTFDGHPATSTMRVPRALEIVLNGPVGPQRLCDDTIVMDEDGWYRTLTPSSSWPAANEVLFSNLDGRNLDGQIDDLIAAYHRLGLPLTWCVYPWTQPTDLGQRLLKRSATQSIIRAFLGNTALPLELVDGVDVEQIDPASTEAYDAYINVMASGFELPADEVAFRRRRYYQLSSGPKPSMQLFIARYHGAIAGCAALVIKADSAHSTGLYVIPAYRAYGVFQSLIAAHLGVLRAMGISFVSGHSNEQSAPWIERFGFKSIYTYSIYQLDPPSSVG